jgi:hypothetical protein
MDFIRQPYIKLSRRRENALRVEKSIGEALPSKRDTPGSLRYNSR